LGKYEESLRATMKKKILIIAASVVLAGVIFMCLYLGLRKDSTAKIKNVSQVQSDHSRTDMEKVLDDQGVEQWGFAVKKDGICFAGADFSLKFYSFDKKSSSTILAAQDDIDSIKIVSTDDSCLYQLIKSQSSDLYLYNSNLSKLGFGAVSPIKANLSFYISDADKSPLVLDSSGNKVSASGIGSTSLFKFAPLSQESAFAITDYDFELQFGDLIYKQNDNIKVLSSVSGVLDLSANAKTAFFTYDAGRTINGVLISAEGDKIAEISDVDPATIRSVADGYYFATKPAGKDSGTNESNAVTFVSNSGQIKNYLLSVDQTDNQFNITGIDFRDGALYLQEAGTIYKLGT